MTDPAFKPLLLDLLRQAQASQQAFFAQLAPADLATSGEPERWSAKDHVAHLTFWRQRLALRLQAIVRQEPQPEAVAFEELNPRIFEQFRDTPWSTLLAESDQAYEELIALTAQLTEEDLTAPNRFDWVGDGMPLYTSFMGNCYEHAQIHLAQYLSERGEPERALQTYEEWANRVIAAQVPATLHGYVLYNLACYYAMHGQGDRALASLRQAFALWPATREFAQSDPDLAGLRDRLAD